MFKYCIEDDFNSEFPREKLEKTSVAMLSDADLIRLLIGICRDTEKNNRLIADVLKAVQSDANLDEIFKKLKAVSGVGTAKASVIVAGLELHRRKVSRKDKITEPADCYRKLRNYKDENQEYFLMMPLNAANEIIDVNVISIGLANQTIVHSREVFAKAIEARAINIIIAHNHPSGDLTPSKSDITTTNNLIKAGEIIGIHILDHVIISPDGFFSFKEHGLV